MECSATGRGFESVACSQLCLSNTEAHTPKSAMLKRHPCLAIAGDGLHRRCQPLPVDQILILRVIPTMSGQTTMRRMALDKQLQCYLYAKPGAAWQNYRPGRSQAAALLYG